jgi:uncharacterized protein YkwD
MTIGHGVALVLFVLVIGTSDPSTGGAAPPSGPSATTAPVRHMLASHEIALYAKDDPWRSYLAGERACPGGERTDVPLARQRQTLACLVNWARRKIGLPPLDLRSTLNRSSAWKAQDIARCKRFAHSPCGGSWVARIRAAGYAGSVGENLYLAAGPWSAPRVAVDGWLNSPAHRANLLNPAWRSQGFAAAPLGTFEGQPDTVVWVSQFDSG